MSGIGAPAELETSMRCRVGVPMFFVSVEASRSHCQNVDFGWEIMFAKRRVTCLKMFTKSIV